MLINTGGSANLAEKNGQKPNALVRIAAAEHEFPVEGSRAGRCQLSACCAPRRAVVFAGSAHQKIRVGDEGAVVWLKFVEPLRLKEGGFSDERSDVQALTPRELETLSLIAKGNTNKLIGAHLAVSENTVKSHVTSIKAKLNAADRTHAVVTAIKLGWLTV